MPAPIQWEGGRESNENESPELHDGRKIGQEMWSHVGRTRSQVDTLASVACGVGGIPHGFCNWVSNEKQMGHELCRLSLSHIIGGARKEERGAEHKKFNWLANF